jgi:transposase
MEAKAKKKRKKHPEEFKREAVRLMEGRGERTVADVAASLGVAENLLHAWKRKYGSAAEEVRRERGGETAEEELKRLRREMTQLKQERDVLKKSVAFFARDRS